MRFLPKIGPRSLLTCALTLLTLTATASEAAATQGAPNRARGATVAQAAPGTGPAPTEESATLGSALDDDGASQSLVASTGMFQAPALQEVRRPAFGPEHGREEKKERKATYASDDPRFVWGFLIAMGLAVVATAGFTWRLSRVRLADGREVGALTLGARLTGTLGTMTVLALGAGAIAAHGVRTQTNASAGAAHVGDEAWGMAEAEKSLLRARIAFNRFQVNNTDAELKAYSDAMGLMRQELEHTAEIASVEGVTENLKELLGLLEEYHQRVARTVAAGDERDAVVASLMTPAAVRATLLLEAVAGDATSSGDKVTAVAALGASKRLQSARLNTMKFLRTGNDAEANAAGVYAGRALAEVNTLRSRVEDADSRARLAEAAGALEFYVSTVARARAANERRDAMIAEAGTVGGAMSKTAEDVLATFNAAQKSEEQRSEAAGVSAKLWTAGAVALIAIVGAVATVITVRTVSSTTSRVLANLQTVAKGDLTAPALNITSNDELGRMAQATDGVARSLRELLGQVAGSTREVAAAATEIAAASEQMSSSLRTQESQTTQVSSAVEEMAASVTEVARKSADAARAALDSGKDAQSGGAVVEGTVEEMRGISEQVSSSSRTVNDLGRKSEQIGQIIGVINDIADQTNLLALNAAIEAARAGEHGRGFAVVADEVRKLAERTTQATGEVARSIREIQGQTAEAVQQIDSGTRRVAKGVELAQNAGEALGRIVAGSQSVERMVQSIAAAAEEQAAASAEISRSVSTIAASVKEAAEGSTQATQAATMLSRQAESLQAQIQRFRL